MTNTDAPSSLPMPVVLVIDDDESIIHAISARLASRYQVVGTTDPRDAVAAATREQPDVILCDINMPGLKGDAVVQALSEHDDTSTIPVIYITSMLEPEETSELDGPFGGYMGISKAASTAELLRVIEAALR